MHVEYIRYATAENSVEAFRAAWTEAATLLRRSPLIEAVEVAQHDERRGEFVVRVEWTNRDAQRAYLATQDYGAFMALIGPFHGGFVSMDFYTPVAGEER